ALATEQGPADQFAGDLVQGGFKGTRDAGNVGGGCRLGNHEGACGDYALVQAVDRFGVELDGGRGQVAGTVVGFETAHVGGQLVVRADAGGDARHRIDPAGILEAAQQGVFQQVGGRLRPGRAAVDLQLTGSGPDADARAVHQPCGAGLGDGQLPVDLRPGRIGLHAYLWGVDGDGLTVTAGQ